MKSGGITRFKFHLTHKDPHNNTKKCRRVLPEVKEDIWSMVHDKTKAKAKKAANIQEICAQLSGTMGASDTQLIDEDDDENVDDQDVYMYSTDMHLDEWDAYWSVVRASKAKEWKRQQYENIVGSKRESEESSCPTGILTMMWKS